MLLLKKVNTKTVIVQRGKHIEPASRTMGNSITGRKQPVLLPKDTDNYVDKNSAPSCDWLFEEW